MGKLVLLDGVPGANSCRSEIIRELEETAQMVRDMEGSPSALGVVVITQVSGRGYAYHAHFGPDKLALQGGLLALQGSVDRSMQCIVIDEKEDPE